MKNISFILIGLFATSCATVNSVIEGGKNIAMTTVDTTVKTGVIDTVVENIDEQTDELQNKPEESE